MAQAWIRTRGVKCRDTIQKPVIDHSAGPSEGLARTNFHGTWDLIRSFIKRYNLNITQKLKPLAFEKYVHVYYLNT